MNNKKILTVETYTNHKINMMFVKYNLFLLNKNKCIYVKNYNEIIKLIYFFQCIKKVENVKKKFLH